jgi:integrase
MPSKRLTSARTSAGSAPDSRSVKAPPAEERKIRPWTAQQVAAIRAAMPERYQAMADLGAGLGLRQGEVLGLAVDDIDFLRRVVHVRRQVKIIGGRMLFGPTKSKKEREVPLPDEVGLRLGAHIAAYPPVAVTLPWHSAGARPVTAALLFTTPSGGAVNRHTWNSAAWRPALAAAGMPEGRGDTGFHQLRHHFASALLAGQVDIRALASYLGHHDPGFTLRVYVHLMPDTADKMRQAVDTALRGDVTTPARVAGNA